MVVREFVYVGYCVCEGTCVCVGACKLLHAHLCNHACRIRVFVSMCCVVLVLVWLCMSVGACLLLQACMLMCVFYECVLVCTCLYVHV